MPWAPPADNSAMSALRVDHFHFADDPNPRLGALLVKKGLITEAQLGEALSELKETGERLGEILLRKRFVFEDELARVLAEKLGMECISTYTISVDPAAVELLEPEVGTRLLAVPVRLVHGGGVVIAVADPTDRATLDELRAAVSVPVTFAVGLPSEIRAMWPRFGG